MVALLSTASLFHMKSKQQFTMFLWGHYWLKKKNTTITLVWVVLVSFEFNLKSYVLIFSQNFRCLDETWPKFEMQLYDCPVSSFSFPVSFTKIVEIVILNLNLNFIYGFFPLESLWGRTPFFVLHLYHFVSICFEPASPYYTLGEHGYWGFYLKMNTANQDALV